jgi:hypothetical protein
MRKTYTGLTREPEWERPVTRRVSRRYIKIRMDVEGTEWTGFVLLFDGLLQML